MIDLNSITFIDEFKPAGGGVDYLNGNIGDEITANLVFDCYWKSKLLNTSSYLKFTTTGGITTIVRNDGGNFLTDGFAAADTFETTYAEGITKTTSLVVAPRFTTQTTLLKVTGGNTLTRKDVGGNFINDGFAVGQTFKATGLTGNAGTYTITAITQTTITAAGMTNVAYISSLIYTVQSTVTRADSGGSFITDGIGTGVALRFFAAGSNTGVSFTTETVTATVITFIQADILVSETTTTAYLFTDLYNDVTSFLIDTVTASTITLDVTTPALLDGSFYLAVLHGTTTFTGVDFYYNQIENSSPESFVSLTDTDATQKYNLGGLDGVAGTPAGLTTMNPQFVTNSSGYIDNTATQIKNLATYSAPTLVQIKATKIAGANFDAYYKQTFEIEQTFYITPLFLASQLAAFADVSLPKISFIDYFKGALCLKYIAKVVAKIDNNANIDSQYPHQSTWQNTSITGQQLKGGNTGWFNENFNGNTPEYSLDTVNTSFVGNTVLCDSSLALINNIIFITSTNSLFSAGNTQAVLHFMYLPKNATQYVGTPLTTLMQNFKYDRVLLTAGAGPINGINFGSSDYQVITDAQAVFISAASLAIEFKIDFGSNLADFFKSQPLDDRNFIFWVTTQDQAIATTINTDRVAVLGIVDNLVCDLDDTTLLTYQNSATGTGISADSTFQSFYEDGADTFSGLQRQLSIYRNGYGGWISDNIYSEIYFKVLKGSSAKINSIESGLVALNYTKTVATGNLYYILLEKYTKDVSSIPVVADQQAIVVDDILKYTLKDDSLFKHITIERVPSLDDGTHVFYKTHFAFKGRYEEWRKELNNIYDLYPTEQVTLPLPRTKNYAVYGNLTAYPNGNYPDGNSDYWTLALIERINVEAPVTQPNIETTHITTFDKISVVEVLDDGQIGLENITLVIKTYLSDASGTIGTEITPKVSLSQHTLVRCIFTKTTAFLTTDITKMYGCVNFDVKNLGGVNFIRQSNTEQDRDTNTIFVGISGTTRAKKSIDGTNTILIIEDVIDPTIMKSEISKSFGALDTKTNPVVLSGRCGYNFFVLKEITYTPTLGTFAVGNAIKGVTSLATGTVYSYAVGVIKIKWTSGVFVVGESIRFPAASGPTATGTILTITDL